MSNSDEGRSDAADERGDGADERIESVVAEIVRALQPAVDHERVAGLGMLVRAFLRGRPRGTAKAYGHALRQFFTVVRRTPWDTSPDDAATFKAWLVHHSPAYTQATISLRLAALTSFFAWLMRPENVHGAPPLVFNVWRSLYRRDVTPEPFTRSRPTDWPSFQRMLATCGDDIIGRRDFAILIFLASTGRRRSETANLRYGDLHVDAGRQLYRITAKGGHAQTYELPTVALEAITEHWRSAGRLDGLKPTSPVFGNVGDRGTAASLDPERPLRDVTVWSVVKRAARRAGLDTRAIIPHGARHMYARDLDRAGLNPRRIQEALGHRRLETTAAYLCKLEGPPPTYEAQLRAVRERPATPRVTSAAR